jgi:phospholipase C
VADIGRSGITRRALVRGAAGATIAYAGSAAVPGWARTLVAPKTLRQPNSRPFPSKPVGFESMPQIEHIVIVMMENHSFDNLLGMVPHQIKSRANVDGLPVNGRGRLTSFNPDANGKRVFPKHPGSPCQLEGKPSQSWNASHISWDGGKNDGFVRASGDVAMWFWQQSDIPLTYSLAKHFPIGERYFQSVLAQTYPNRRFLFSGTASGTIATDNSTFSIPAANGTIFDRLDQVGVAWKDYYENVPSPAIIPGAGDNRQGNFVKGLEAFTADAANGVLPQVSYVEPDYDTTSEEDPQDIQVGEQFVEAVVKAAMDSPTWKKTAVFLTYDEHGGYFDHVPPPKAIEPDSIPPMTKPGDQPGSYNRYGFRVPLIVVSPWARPRYVSRRVQDHTSILAFMERKWNLPAMTFRDANADPMTDYFDFSHAAFAKPPKLASAPPLGPGLRRCDKHGLHPPLPPGTPTPYGVEAGPPSRTGIGALRVPTRGL